MKLSFFRWRRDIRGLEAELEALGETELCRELEQRASDQADGVADPTPYRVSSRGLVTAPHPAA